MGSSPSASFPMPMLPLPDSVGEDHQRDASNVPQQQNNSFTEPVQSTLNMIRERFETNNDMMPKENVVPTFLSGTFAFYATAFSSQSIQHKLLKISTGTRPAILPISAGVATVALGSWMGHLAGLGTTAAWGTVQKSWRENKLLENIPMIGRMAMGPIEEMTRPMRVFADGMSRYERRERKEAWMHAARICIIGLFTYKAVFRSHFFSLSPSSYTARGSFARIGIPAPPNFNYATRLQRKKLERIGHWFGCHTCGSHMIFSNLSKNKPRFHGDHIPPVSVAKQINNRWYRRTFGWKVSQKFYPQCRNCSNKQGGLLSKAINAGHQNLRSVGGGEQSYFHGRRLRVGHLTGGAVAVLCAGNSGNERQLAKASRMQVLSIQCGIKNLGTELKHKIESAWASLW